MGDMSTPLQFPSLNDGQEVFVWSDCLLDLGTDFLVGNMVFVRCLIYYASHIKTMLPTRKSVPRIQQAIAPHKDDLTIIKRHKLQWYGHVSCSSGLAKPILQGTVKGERRLGRQRKGWEDNISKWTGLEFAKSQRAVENRGRW